MSFSFANISRTKKSHDFFICVNVKGIVLLSIRSNRILQIFGKLSFICFRSFPFFWCFFPFITSLISFTLIKISHYMYKTSFPVECDRSRRDRLITRASKFEKQFSSPPAQFPRDLSWLTLFGALSELLFLQMSHP